MSDRKTFEYGGYHFTPIRKFHKKEGDFFAISKRLASDPNLGLCTYQERQKAPYAISLKEVRDGKIFGDLYPLNYREHVERMKKLTCPIGNVAVAFEDGNIITIPYQERRQLLNRLMPEHGAPKTMTYLPENEPELMIILKRERFKRSYHATAGNLEEYLDKLEKTTLREKLKRAKTVVSTQEVSSHKRGLER